MCTDIAIYRLSECNKIRQAEHLLTHLEFYAGLGYDRVKFLHGTCYGAVFWICAGIVLITQGLFIIVEQCSHKTKVFSASQPTPSVQGLGVHEFGGDTPGAADPS